MTHIAAEALTLGKRKRSAQTNEVQVKAHRRKKPERNDL
jgi:hypothetical protein